MTDADHLKAINAAVEHYQTTQQNDLPLMQFCDLVGLLVKRFEEVRKHNTSLRTCAEQQRRRDAERWRWERDYLPYEEEDR